ncbi:hypothetical protein HUX88_17110 [Duganella sp. BJB1802]|uniref:hypothetical protein n=1 Tax=Duganella sp. BJB1802 TaxID=2744575 RepID=UPI001593A780|nr:hypothetical protein [Duganella sp. BJB1802]NVD72255.1 hypothetical protein [Duganella sp. BJB1802]
MPTSPKIKPTYNLQFPIRVPDDVLVELGEFTGNFWSDSLAQEPFVIEAIRNYINPPPLAPQQPAAASEAGYQWKQVFLPEGTRLRASFGSKPYFATVVGAEIKYEGHAVSPSCFANLHGSGNRNAWKAVWLRLPGSSEWLLADVCRSARKAAIVRLHEGGAQADRDPAEGERAPAPPSARQPAARHPPASQTWPRPAVGQSSAPAAQKSDAQRRSGSGSSSRRRKRRALKNKANPH